MITACVGKHDALIADLMIRVSTLESSQQECVEQKVAGIAEKLRAGVETATAAMTASWTTRINLMDVVLRDVVKRQERLVMEVAALTSAEEHDRIHQDIRNLQQMVNILKRKHPVMNDQIASSVTMATSMPIRQYNAAALNSVAERVDALDKSFEILNAMHHNLRTELAEINLVEK